MLVPIRRRLLAALVPLSALVLALPAAAAETILRPDQLVILSTTDVRGKTSPCGCKIPKGGLSRQASFADSIRAEYGQVLVVDNGGFFPEDDARRDVASFLMDAMHSLDVSAVGVGERDLRFGVAFLLSEARRSSLPVTCANLVDRTTRKTVLAPSILQKTGGLRVGLFAMIATDADLGPAKDSLEVLDPATTAKRVTAELRKKGADVVVLLSQLGKIGSEDLVADVDGIDAVVVGRDTPVVPKGRVIKNTIACYGGEQGQHMCETMLTLDVKRRVINREASAVMLSPEVGDKPGVLKMVKDFEDSMVERARRQNASANTTPGAPNSTPPSSTP